MNHFFRYKTIFFDFSLAVVGEKLKKSSMKLFQNKTQKFYTKVGENNKNQKRFIASSKFKSKQFIFE